MPRHAKRIKIRRKALRRPDEFTTLTGRAVAWLGDHRALALGSAAVALVLALGAFGLGHYRAARFETAARDFRAAYDTFQAGKFGEAADAFTRLAGAYPRTPFGRLARLYRGHAVARQGDGAAAATAYGEYLATASGPLYLRQEALADLARAREASGDSAGAIEAYTQAGALEGPYRTDALLGAARLHEVAGQEDKAREIYAGLLKEGPEPDLRALLLTKLPKESTAPAESGTGAPTGEAAEAR